MTAQFTLAQAEALIAQMPELQFDVQQDSAWLDADEVQAYLNFYRINFAKTIPYVSHGFGYLDACNFRIAIQYWLPHNPRGTLVAVHGYYDHAGLLTNVIEYGLRQGLAVVVFDLPGHGLSSGERVAISSFDQYADVLNAILMQSNHFFPETLYAIGQSTGGSVLLNYLWRYQTSIETAKRFHRIALCAPLVLPRAWFLGRILYAVLHKFIHRLKRGVSRNSHDKTFIDFVDNRDCLQSKYLSVVWVGAMKAWNRQFSAWLPKATNVLVIQGTGDMTVAWRYNVKLIRKQLPNAEVHFIADAGHQLVNESQMYRTPLFLKLTQYFFQ